MRRATGPLILAVAALSFAAPAAALSPPADFEFSPQAPAAGADVVLEASEGASAYAWDLDGDGAYDDATGRTVHHQFPAGRLTVGLEARDAEGRAAFAYRTVGVHPTNEPPWITRSIGVTTRAGTPVSYQLIVVDVDSGVAAVDFDFDGDGTFESPAVHVPAGPTFGIDRWTATRAFTAGSNPVAVRATDRQGASSILRDTVEAFTRNLAPEGSVLGFGGGTRAQVIATFRAPGAAVRSVTFDFDSDGTWDATRSVAPSTNETIVRHDYPAPGRYEARARLNDGTGTPTVLTGRVLAGLDFNARDPRIEIAVTGDFKLFFNRTAAVVNAPIELSGREEAVVDGEVFDWDLDGDGTFEITARRVVTATFPTPGTHMVALRERVRGEPAIVVRRSIVVRPGDLPPTTRFDDGFRKPPGVLPVLQFGVDDVDGEPDYLDFDLDDDADFDDLRLPYPGDFNIFSADPPLTPRGGVIRVGARTTDEAGATDAVRYEHPVATAVLPPYGGILGGAGELAPGEPIAFRAWGEEIDSGTTANKEGNNLLVSGYTWDLDGDGAYDDSADPFPVATYEGEGRIEVGLRLESFRGGVQEIRRTFYIGDEPAPPPPPEEPPPPAQRPPLVTVGTSAPPPVQAAPAAGEVLGTVDSNRFRVSVRARKGQTARTVLRRGLLVRLTCSIACRAVVGIDDARGRRIGRRVVRGAPDPRRIRIRIASRSARGLLRRGRPLHMQLVVRATAL